MIETKCLLSSHIALHQLRHEKAYQYFDAESGDEDNLQVDEPVGGSYSEDHKSTELSHTEGDSDMDEGHEYDEHGYDAEGYDREGYDKEGYDEDGYDNEDTPGPRVLADWVDSNFSDYDMPEWWKEENKDHKHYLEDPGRFTGYDIWSDHALSLTGSPL